MRFHSLVLLLLCSLLPSVRTAQAQANDKDVAELRRCILNMDTVTRVYITMHEIKLAAEKDPNLQKSMSAESGDDEKSQSLDSITNRFSAYPAIVSVIAKNHFTPHEFVVAQLSLIQAGMAAAAIKMGASRDKLVADGAASAANLDFVQQHQSELEEFGKKYPVP